MNFQKRIDAIKASLKTGDGFLVTEMNNVRYLTGFTGSSGFVLFTKSRAVFATDSRYAEQSKREVSSLYDTVIQKTGRMAAFRRLIKTTSITSLRFESSVSYEFFRRLSAIADLKPVKGTVEKLRAVKEAEEIVLMKEAIRRAETAFLQVKPHIKAGTTERAVALRLEEKLKKMGCRRLPFDIIVAFGENAALPHARPADRKLKAGDLVLIDWGGESGGYFSDMTRTLLLKGKEMGKKTEICRTVLEANRKGIKAVRDGKPSWEIDKAARDVIKKAGYGDYFGHSLGHGVGLQVHEMPNIRRTEKRPVKKDMVFTIEPGIYVPGLGGVRIEDMIMVGDRGAEILTNLSPRVEIISR